MNTYSTSINEENEFRIRLDFMDVEASAEAPIVPLEKIELLELLPEQIDPRILALSHSSRTMLHSCPRKFQLYRLSADTIITDELKHAEKSVTFAYGTAVGVGIQSILQGLAWNEVVLRTFLAWDVDLLEENTKQNKSFWQVLSAVQKFTDILESTNLVDYELVYINDDRARPAIELSFQILLPEGFRYRGFVDAVLRHKTTGEILVLECKTSSATAHPAQFKNSGQALGYSVILDLLFPSLSSYTVLYLVYESKSYTFRELPFEKTLLQRALWLQELLIDTQMIQMYASFDVYPTHGESCYAYFAPCEYFNLCTMETQNLVKPYTTKIAKDIEEETASYDFTIHFSALLNSQLAKGEA